MIVSLKSILWFEVQKNQKVCEFFCDGHNGYLHISGSASSDTTGSCKSSSSWICNKVNAHSQPTVSDPFIVSFFASADKRAAACCLKRLKRKEKRGTLTFHPSPSPLV